MPGQWVYPLSVQVTELAICIGCLVLDKKTQFIAICIGFATPGGSRFSKIYLRFREKQIDKK